MKKKVFAIYIIVFTLTIGCNKNQSEDEAKVPILITNPATEVSYRKAIAGGKIISEGGARYTTNHGICWSTGKNPTINDYKIGDNSELDSFTFNLSNLEPNTTYYFRAYATNMFGTGYGISRSFKTLDKIVPKIITKEVKSVARTTAISGGYIENDGDEPILACGVCWSKSPDPTIDDDKTVDELSSVSYPEFTSHLSNLSINTTYYVRAYAVNSTGVGYGSTFTITTCGDGNGVTDVEGNVYRTIYIGQLEWMAENLKTTKYNDGTDIPNITDKDQWVNDINGAYCWYDNNINYKESYGALYNYYAVATDKLCPVGWRVPTPDEYKSIKSSFREYDALWLERQYAGGVLKSTIVAPSPHPRWSPPNIGATDEIRFSALPGGVRADGDFRYLCYSAYFIASNPYTYVYLDYLSESISIGNISGDNGQSLRCVKSK